MANDKDPLLGALGICRKAGKLLHGYDRVEEAVMRGKACLVLLACDASKRTTQHMQDTCRGVIPCAVMPLKGSGVFLPDSGVQDVPHQRQILFQRQLLKGPGGIAQQHGQQEA